MADDSITDEELNEGLIRFGYTDRNRGQAIRRKFDDRAKLRCLKAYAETGSFAVAAAAAGVSTKTVRQYRAEEPEFAEALEMARDLLCEKLQKECIRRAVDGVEQEHHDKEGNHLYTKIIYSDRLLELLLKRFDPKYRESFKAELAVQGGVLVVPGSGNSDIDKWAEAHAGDAGGSSETPE